MPQPAEGMPQTEVVLRLRAAIDTAIRFPNPNTVASALAIAQAYPKAMRSAHINHNLGLSRWQWLNDHGFYAALDPSEEADRVQGTINPDYTG